LNYTSQIITLKLLGILFILFKNGAPSPVNLVKYTDILDKCILLSLLPYYGTAHPNSHSVGHLPLISVAVG